MHSYLHSPCYIEVLKVLLCRHAWADQKRRRVLYQSNIRAARAISTSSE